MKPETLRKQTVYRLPLAERAERVSALIHALSYLDGGAKQTQHYTDLTPAVLVLAVTKHGNNPFYRMLTSTRQHTTQFHEPAFREILTVYKDQLLSDVYVGWAHGFLDEERAKLEACLKDFPNVRLGHPVEQARTVAEELRKNEHAGWYE